MEQNQTVDTSMFSAHDAFDIGLQRTAHFRSKFGFRLWAAGFPHVLLLEARLRRSAIIAGALKDAENEFKVIADILPNELHRVVDIGCGHALIDLFFWRRFQCDIHLVDIEKTSTHHHDFHQSGSGYASLDAAHKFLVGNGVPSSIITRTNPHRTQLADSACDLIFSLLSCGFHYPASTYLQFIKIALRPGGIFLFDMRKDSGQEPFLREFSDYAVVEDKPKYLRIAATRR
jgi:SAM-dependent methyltransferase